MISFLEHLFLEIVIIIIFVFTIDEKCGLFV